MLFICENGLKGLRNKPREGGAWSQGETCWRSAEWARRGVGLVTWAPPAPGELPGRVGHSDCLQRAGDQAGQGQQRRLPGISQRPAVGAAGCPGGGVCWFPLCHLKAREASGCAARPDGAEHIGSWFTGGEQG